MSSGSGATAKPCNPRFDIVTQDISVTAMFEKETTVAVTIEEGNTTMRVGDTLVLHANLLVNGEAGDNDMIQWAVNGELQHNGYSYNFTPTTAGTYTVRAGAEVDGVFASQEITVTVEQPVTKRFGHRLPERGSRRYHTLTASVENGSGDTTWSCPQMPNWSATGDCVQFTTVGCRHLHGAGPPTTASPPNLRSRPLPRRDGQPGPHRGAADPDRPGTDD